MPSVAGWREGTGGEDAKKPGSVPGLQGVLPERIWREVERGLAQLASRASLPFLIFTLSPFSKAGFDP